MFLAEVPLPCCCAQWEMPPHTGLAPATWSGPAGRVQQNLWQSCKGSICPRQEERAGAAWGTQGQRPPGPHGSRCNNLTRAGALTGSTRTALGLPAPTIRVSLPPGLVFPSFCNLPALSPPKSNSSRLSVQPLSPARQHEE